MAYWALVGNTYYVRDAAGKEIAIYNSGGLVQCAVGVPSGEYVWIGPDWTHERGHNKILLLKRPPW